MHHIALATIADADVLVSWDFRHIVRLDKIRLFNAVNIECGYKPLTICSPREVVSDEQTSEMRAVDLVREIRDAQASKLAKKSPTEIIEFFNSAGYRAKRTRSSNKRASTLARRITSR